MFPDLEFIKTCLNGLRSRIEKVEKSISKALVSIKAQLTDIIQDIKNVRTENAEAIKSSTADWGQNDSNALDYVKNRTHYMLPATPIGSLEFTATSSDTIEYTMTEAEEENEIFRYFQALNNKGEVLKVTVGGKEGLLAVTFDRGHFNFSGVFTGTVKWNTGEVLSLIVQNDFITFNQGDIYTVSFEDTTKPYYVKLDFNYIPDNVYHSENAPVKFGAGENSTVQGYETTATGRNAHAEGNNTVASGSDSHAEGYVSNASGHYTHAEGSYTVANRQGMHVEGKYNLYDSAQYVDEVTIYTESYWGNKYAASEYTFDADTGYYTLVNAELKSEAVIGLYYASASAYKNGTITLLEKPISLISGTNYKTEKHVRVLGTIAQGKYVHVVGNGNSSTRSNAHTLDWDGNGWFAGDVFVGGASQDEGFKLLKEGEAIPIPQTASVGQVLAVKAVDENGKPTEWEAGEVTGGTGGTSDHSKLSNRDAADQHPIGAITGLEAALDGKQPAGSYLTEESDPTVPAWAKETEKPSYTAQEVGADPSGTAAGLVAAHNTAEAAHNDIRLLISGLTERLNALADSDDTTLDQLSEVVAYIKSNRTLIEAITTNKVSVSDIVDNLTTSASNKPLSAAQGVALKALIDAISIPDKLPNPNSLTFTGAATGSYDGSKPLEVEIPSGGSEPEYDYEKVVVLDEAVTSYIIDTFDDDTPLALSSLEVISVTTNNTASTVTVTVLTDLPFHVNAGKLIASTIGGYTGAGKWMYCWLDAKIKNGECRADFACQVNVTRYVSFYSGIYFGTNFNHLKSIPAITFSTGTTEIFPNKATKFTSVEISVPAGSIESGSMIRIRGVKA